MAVAPTIEVGQPRSYGLRRDSSGEAMRPRRARRWLRILLVVIGVFFVFDFGLSFVLETGWLNHSLTPRLEAAFGRPVEVSNYSFSLLQGPRLEANYITVGEDPRFGHEYFLRADQLAIGVRWSELLRGHMEFGTLSFARPHLSLVHLADGEWNLESWLPRPRGNFPATPGRASARIARIDVSDGRVDFKQDDDKLPFAFVNVEGSVEQVVPGRWRIDLQAQPFRAAVVVQQAGLLSLRGLMGGTSSRLRPAALELDWNAASLPDVLRLVRGWDYGVRGLLSLQMAARTSGTDWDFSSRAQFRSLHRWDLALRADDPAVNLNVDARWRAGESRMEVTQAVLETPRSNVHATGSLAWISGVDASHPALKDSQLEITSRGVDLADVLTCYRAFHKGVAEQDTLEGAAMLDLSLSGWPPRVQSGFVRSSGAELDGGAARAPIRMGRASLIFSGDGATLEPLTFFVGTGLGEFNFAGSVQHAPRAHSAWKLDGQTADVQLLIGSAAALGFSLPPGWVIEGPAQAHLQWQGAPWPAWKAPQGNVTTRGLKIYAPFLNRAITHVVGTVNLSTDALNAQIAAADAFGTSWRGTLQRSDASRGWQFALTANELDAAEMDRWLNPQRRENFLTRILPFLAAQSQPQPMPVWLQGHGTLALNQFTLAPFVLHQLRADAAVDGRELHLTNAQTDFYGGKLLVSIALDLVAQPTYQVDAKFRDVNLSQLAAHTFSLADLFSGSASGNLQISAKGVGRDALLHSLVCQGNAEMRGAGYDGMDLIESMDAGARGPGSTLFPLASADFSCSAGKVQFSRLRLNGPRGQFEAAGYVDFQRRMNFELRPFSAPLALGDGAKGTEPTGVFDLSGSLKAPELSRAVPHSPSR